LVTAVPRLSSGLVIVGAYAIKVRRTLFAQLRDRTRADKEWAQKVAFAAAQLNRVLFEVFVNRLKLDKGDVVRVRIDYDVDEEKKEVVWRWDTLTVEVFRRLANEQVAEAVKEVASRVSELLAVGVRYELEKLGETEDGDVVYSVKTAGREVGTVIVTPLDDELLVKTGAVLEPFPMTIGRSRLPLGGRPAEEAVAEYVSKATTMGRQVEEEAALKLINDLRSRVSAKPLEGVAEEEGGGEGA
jgi:hypothetical protein